MPRFSFTLFGLILTAGLTSCTAVKPYQRSYLNDPEMDMAMSAAEKMENYAQNIREGAVTPGDSKSSGGCGCN
ncbi:MAG: hypothetical protein JWO03_2373 [Bacteroidetes bacterium]|nr:hypothetical protein [Bacteroidota bacterium]